MYMGSSHQLDPRRQKGITSRRFSDSPLRVTDEFKEGDLIELELSNSPILDVIYYLS